MKNQRSLLLFTIALGILLNPLNSSMISVAIARFQDVFQLSFTTVSWLISTYYLASAIAQPVMGKLADLMGRKKIFITGLVLVAVTSVTAPFAPSFGWLVVLRMIQAVGSSAIYPAGMAIVRHRITERQAQALAFLAVFSSGAAGFGPTIGGVLMHWQDWPAIFMVNIPVIIVGFLLALWVLPKDDVAGRHQKSSVGKLIRSLDPLGIALFTIAIVGVLMFLLSIRSGVQIVPGTVGFLALVAFIWREQKVPNPFIDLRLFARNRVFMWVHVQFVTVNIIFYSLFFGMPTYLQEVRHMDTQETGLLMLCLAGVSVLIAPLAGRWIDQSGSRPPLLLAGVLMTLGTLLMMTLHQTSPVIWIMSILFLLGVSNGFNNVGMQAALFASTPPPIIGAASGLFMTARYFGTIISTMLLGLVFGAALSTQQLRILGVILALFSVLVVWMSYRLPKGKAQIE